MNFEQQLKKLEEIVLKLESGECTFDEATSLFEEGKQIAKSCAKLLDDNKGKITELSTELDTIIEKDMK